MRIVSRLGVAAILGLAAFGGARLGKALRGPLAGELGRTHWGGPQRLTCDEGSSLEVRGESVFFPELPAVEAAEGCDVTLRDTTIQADRVLDARGAGTILIDNSRLSGSLTFRKGEVVSIRGSHVGSVELDDGSNVTFEGGSLREATVADGSKLTLVGLSEAVASISVEAKSTLSLTDARVEKLRFVNGNYLTMLGGSVDKVSSLNNNTLVFRGPLHIGQIRALNTTDLMIKDASVHEILGFNDDRVALVNSSLDALELFNESRLAIQGGTAGRIYMYNDSHGEAHGAAIAELSTEPRGSFSADDARVATQEPPSTVRLDLRSHFDDPWFDP